MFNSSGITESTSMNFSLLLESQTPEKDVWIISLGNNQTRPWQLRMEYIRDTTGDPDSQQPPRSSSIRICICICSKNVILTSVMFWLLTYSVLRIRLSSSLAEMTFLGQETKRKRHKHIPVYMRYVRFNGCLCALWPFYRSYTINCHTNPHNLASRILWWVSGLSVLTPPSICLFKESKQAKKERLAEPLHSTVDDRKVENLLLKVTRHKLVINLTSLLRPARAWFKQARVGSLRDSGPSGCEGD